MNTQSIRFCGIAIAFAICLLCTNTTEAGFGKKMKKFLNNTPSGYETPQQHQARRNAEIEAARKEVEARRLQEARLARQTAYERIRSDAWNRFQTTMSETIQPVLGAAKDDCPDAYSGLNAAVAAMQDGFRALPPEEDDAGSAAQKLSDWEKGIASLIESARQTKDALEKRRAELAKAESERMLAVLSKLADLHAAKRHDGTSEFTNRMAWATGNKLWATEREVATEVRKRTGLELKDCTPAAKEFQSQLIKYLDAAAKCKYEFGSLSATGEVFLVSTEWMPNDEPQLVSNVLAAIKDYYQFPAGVCEREDRVITGYNLDSGNLSPWGLYQFNYFTKRMDDGVTKANKSRDRIVNMYSIKPYVQTTTTFSCDGYDIVVKSDERGENVMSVKTTDTVVYSEIKKNN